MMRKACSWRKSEINRVLKGHLPYGNIYRMKISSDEEETKWMSISRDHIKKIKKVL